MNVLPVVVAWCLLRVVSWPLAIAALILWPVVCLVWLVALPFRVVGTRPVT